MVGAVVRSLLDATNRGEVSVGWSCHNGSHKGYLWEDISVTYVGLPYPPPIRARVSGVDECAGGKFVKKFCGFWGLKELLDPTLVDQVRIVFSRFRRIKGVERSYYCDPFWNPLTPLRSGRQFLGEVRDFYLPSRSCVTV